jgi:hypothetical protein
MENTMHGRKCFVFTAALILTLFAGCSSNSLLKPDCHSCTVEEQEWKEFSWGALEGKWKGTVENTRNERDQSKKSRTEKAAEFSFVRADKFLSSCQALPAGALVLNGLLWEKGSETGAREYEAFVPAEDGKVAYGRVSVSKMNGKDLCQFRRLGRVMGKNRLNLPTVSFSGQAARPQEISVEFLRFASTDQPSAFQSDGRKPASAREQERPSLMFRVFKISTVPTGRHDWAGTEEYIYRLWKTQ